MSNLTSRNMDYCFENCYRTNLGNNNYFVRREKWIDGGPLRGFDVLHDGTVVYWVPWWLSPYPSRKRVAVRARTLSMMEVG